MVCAEGNHGKTVASVAQATPRGPGHGATVAAAAQSDCGKATDDDDTPIDDSIPAPTHGRGARRSVDVGPPADVPGATAPGRPDDGGPPADVPGATAPGRPDDGGPPASVPGATAPGRERRDK